MICRNTKIMYYKTEGEAVKTVLYVEIISDTVPSPFPTTPVGLEGCPAEYTANNCIMGAGSIVYVVSTGTAYMLNTQGNFVEQ